MAPGRSAITSMSPFCRNSLLLLTLATSPALADEPLTLERKLDLLAAAYPAAIERVEDNLLYFIDDGEPLEIDDGHSKSHAEKLQQADIEDMLSQIYPAGPCERETVLNFDPGRIRSDTLMRRLFGASANEVRKQLTSIDWFGQKLSVTTRHDVDKALIKVRDAIAADPELVKYATRSGGTYNWRNIAGTRRLSVHSFGAAIDLNTGYADYWRWAGGKPGDVPQYRNSYPMKLVALFEQHGFIWGGRWYHYDTMHFEYRPELLAIAAESPDGDACSEPGKPEKNNDF